MKLYDHPLSPFAFKVRILLYEKGIEFEKCEIHREGQREELLKRNPRGEVPALENGGDVVWDSKVIGDYLEDLWPTPPLLPETPADRARARRIELFADGPLDATTILLALFAVLRPELGASEPAALENSKELLRAQQEKLDRELGSRAFFAGTFSRADAAVAPHIIMAATIGYGVPPEFANLSAWLARVNARDSVKRATGEAMEAFGVLQHTKDPFFSNDHLHWRNDRIEALVRVGLGSWLLRELESGGGFLGEA